MPNPNNLPKNPLCIFCQLRPGITKDHVFAKAFFGSVLPEHSMKVPACRECNAGRGNGHERDMSEDEEYLRTIVAAERNAETHPTAKRLIENEISRSLKLNAKLRSDLTNASLRIDLQTPSGIVIPNMLATKMDVARTNRVIEKMVRGLFYTYSPRTWPIPCPLPRSWPVTAKRISLQEFHQRNKEMDSWPQALEWTNMGSECAVRYRGALKSKQSNVSLWLLLFYDAVAFMAHTFPNPGSPEERVEEQIPAVNDV